MTPETILTTIAEIDAMRLQSQAKDGLPLALELIEKLREVHHPQQPDWLGRALGLAAIFYTQLNDYSSALQYYEQSLTLREKTDDKKSAAGVLHNIGAVYLQLKNYDRAMEYFLRAFDINSSVQNSLWMAHNLSNIGGTYILSGQAELALEPLSRALQLYEELGDKRTAGIITGNIGSAYEVLSEYDKAKEFFHRALATNESLSNTPSIIGNFISLAGLHLKTSFSEFSPLQSEEYLKKALKLNEQVESKKLESQVYRILFLFYEMSERWKEALETHKLLFDLEQQLQSDAVHHAAELFEHRRKIDEAERSRQLKMARFQEQEKILHNMLPAHIADRMIEGEKTIADSHQSVSVFFSDIIGFTKISQSVTPEQLVEMLNRIFTEFDRIAHKHGLEKIKTIGDAYMAVAGAPIAQENHAERAALFAIEVAEYMETLSEISGIKPQIRIGLHTGSVVAGIIGESKFAYDLWGDAVNTASRMESHGEAGKIHCTKEFMDAVSAGHDLFLQFIPRGEMDIKGKGIMNTYFLEKA